jgi:hypothetical protein
LLLRDGNQQENRLSLITGKLTGMKNNFLSVLSLIIGLIGAALFVLAVAGCRSSREIKESKHELRDSVREVIKYRDSIIKIKGDSVKIKVQVPCPDAKWQGQANSGKLKLDASLYNGELNIDCKTDSLLLVIKMQEKELERFRNEQQVDSSVKVITKMPFWAKPALCISIIAIVLFVIKHRSMLMGLGVNAFKFFAHAA